MVKKESKILSNFFLGIFLFLFIQLIFMLGGLFLEKSMGSLITGLPSVIGLTLIFLIGLYYNAKGKEYMFLGNFILAFLSPLIVFMIFLFTPDSVAKPLVYYTLSYMAILVVAVDFYLARKIWRSAK